MIRRIVGACLLLGLPSFAAAADSALLLTGREGAVPVHLEVTIGERKLADLWQENFAALTAFCDRDDDGKLNEAEVAKLPSVQSVREVLGAGFTPFFGKAPELAEVDTSGDKFADAREVAEFYRRAGLGAPLVGAGRMSHSAELNAALVKMLDVNADGKVEENELKNAAAAIAKFDRNDDEMIGAGELVAGLRYPGAAGTHLLKPVSADSRESGSNPAKFSAVVLQTAEQNEKKADFVIAVAWHAGAVDKDAKEAAKVSAVAPADIKPRDGSLTFAKSGLQLVVRIDPGKLAETADGVFSRLERRFGDVDANDDKLLDATEIEKAEGTEWPNVRTVADRNNDGKLAETELQAWTKVQKQLANAQLLLTLLDGGGLFELLDGNRDGALSAGELRGATERINSAGALKDGKLDLERVPQTMLLTISRGYPVSVLGTTSRSGPSWFLAMDRNQDGEVSRREFSGPAAAFGKLDTNGDEIISEPEAAKAKQ